MWKPKNGIAFFFNSCFGKKSNFLEQFQSIWLPSALSGILRDKKKKLQPAVSVTLPFGYVDTLRESYPMFSFVIV